MLKDKTTKRNIIFSTNAYSIGSAPIGETEQITEDILRKFSQVEIQPRVLKSLEQQQERTRAKAEVFTPSWICNKMSNHCDEEWFGRKMCLMWRVSRGGRPPLIVSGLRNRTAGKKYVDSKRLEITRGEAPYLVSRYAFKKSVKERHCVLVRGSIRKNENYYECTNCTAELKYGAVSIFDFEEKVKSIKVDKNYMDFYEFEIEMQGEKGILKYTLRHIISLQTALKFFEENRNKDVVDV